ncbi:hypothetical protein PNOK_0715700 [Pyrrhoderma noxium]|uniref:WD40 domain containing protein n=1 Tax=Pyrrhoderma noxium TaxID=2282107 RepID=A0A286UBX8_9AGAM|nr:hypothetical protein PNOK_0715700 [Pyrrhoderma noxium]
MHRALSPLSMSQNKGPLCILGYYWDEERRRYFPESSRPKGKLVPDEDRVSATATSSEPTRIDHNSLPHRKSLLRSKASLQKGVSNYVQRTSFTHEMEKRSLGLYTELETPVRPLNWGTKNISSFHATILDDTLNVLVGDSNGYLHCSRAVAQNCSKSGSEPDKFNHNSRLFTSYYTTVCRPIRHIAQSKETAVAVIASGDSCLLCTRDLKAPDSQGVIFSKINFGGDVWAADLHQRELSLSVAKKLVVVKDHTDLTRRNVTVYPLISDALSICRRENAIFTGSRNGNVSLFDIRAAKSQVTNVLGSRYNGTFRSTHSAVTHLKTVREWNLLAGTSSGELEMFDLRFCSEIRPVPCMVFNGHVNSYSLDLGLSIDPTSTFLFAAGQDRQIRAWSLHTGESLGPLLEGIDLSDHIQSISVTPSLSRVNFAISSVDEQRVQDSLRGIFGPLWLWVAQKRGIRVFRLGSHDGDF